MNILEYKDLIVGGIAAVNDVSLTMETGRYTRIEETVVIFVKSGEARVELNFINYDLKCGAVLTVVPQSTIKCHAVTDDFCVSLLCFDQGFGVEAIPRPEPSYFDFIRSYPLGSMPAPRREPIHASIANVVYFLYENDGKHRMLIVKNIVQSVLLEIYDDVKKKFLSDRPRTVDRQHDLFMQFIHLVHQYGDKHRDVMFFAGKLCITTRYLASIVHNIAGETAKDIIDRHCVQEIKSLLRTTNRSIQSIAIELDFPDQSFFTRYFKKLVGKTPKEFRSEEFGSLE